MRDPYQYGPILVEIDLYLFFAKVSIGSCLTSLWRICARSIASVAVYFAVWAPNAQRVSVVGDFNRWDGRVNPMRKLLSAGVWELFVPHVAKEHTTVRDSYLGPVRFCSRAIRSRF